MVFPHDLHLQYNMRTNVWQQRTNKLPRAQFVRKRSPRRAARHRYAMIIGLFCNDSRSLLLILIYLWFEKKKKKNPIVGFQSHF
jgi:hypothetical protein